jgi:hypothetical protein
VILAVLRSDVIVSLEMEAEMFRRYAARVNHVVRPIVTIQHSKSGGGT